MCLRGRARPPCPRAGVATAAWQREQTRLQKSLSLSRLRIGAAKGAPARGASPALARLRRWISSTAVCELQRHTPKESRSSIMSARAALGLGTDASDHEPRGAGRLDRGAHIVRVRMRAPLRSVGRGRDPGRSHCAEVGVRPRSRGESHVHAPLSLSGHWPLPTFFHVLLT